MLDWLFIVFGLAGIILILAGYFMQTPGVVMLGGIMLFVLSMITFSEGISFRTGDVEVQAPPLTYTTTYAYTPTMPRNDLTLNTLTTVMSAVGFIAILGSAWVVYKS